YVVTYGSSITSISGSLEGDMVFASGGDKTVEIQGTGAFASTDCQIQNIAPGTENLRIAVYRFPAASEIAYRPELLPGSWSGYHGNDCSFARTNTAYGDPAADASCTFTERTNQNF